MDPVLCTTVDAHIESRSLTETEPVVVVCIQGGSIPVLLNSMTLETNLKQQSETTPGSLSQCIMCRVC